MNTQEAGQMGYQRNTFYTRNVWLILSLTKLFSQEQSNLILLYAPKHMGGNLLFRKVSVETGWPTYSKWTLILSDSYLILFMYVYKYKKSPF